MNLKYVHVRRVGLLVVCTLTCLFHVWMGASLAQEPATQPGAKRGVAEIMGEIQNTGTQLREVLSSPAVLMDDAQRAQAVPKVIPPLRQMLALAEELGGVDDPQAGSLSEQLTSQFEFLLLAFDDAEIAARVKKEAEGTGDGAIRAKSMLLMAGWMHSTKDAQKQSALLDEAIALLKANPQNEELNDVLEQMSQMPAASPEIQQRAQQALAAVQSTRPPMNLENQPLTVAGVLQDGTQFSTEQWKGKVVLVDFWATWCEPCIAELPRVKKVYAEYHDKGLEIIGVSCDEDVTSLQSFLEKNKDMPWPQLFDATNPGWHALANQWGVDSIPRMFLIDKKGIVRTVQARQNFEEMIPKLLAE